MSQRDNITYPLFVATNQYYNPLLDNDYPFPHVLHLNRILHYDGIDRICLCDNVTITANLRLC